MTLNLKDYVFWFLKLIIQVSTNTYYALSPSTKPAVNTAINLVYCKSQVGYIKYKYQMYCIVTIEINEHPGDSPSQLDSTMTTEIIIVQQKELLYKHRVENCSYFDLILAEMHFIRYLMHFIRN